MKRLVLVWTAVLLMVGAFSFASSVPCLAAPQDQAAVPAAQDFYLKDGDRVVFYGDSITDQRLYTTYIETYCLSRFPKRHFTFIHSGWGGDRVSGGGGGPIDRRLRRDVLVYKPTVVTICLGMNDGGYRAFDQGLFDTYVQGYTHILDTLKRELPGVRITLLTAPAYDDVSRAPNFPGGYNQTLIRYGDAVRELGQEYNLVVADTNAPLLAALQQIQGSPQASLASQVIPDRVHPGPAGHLIMAAAVLKAWHAPETVAEVHINTQSATAEARNARVSDLKVTPDRVSFTLRMDAIPWPLERYDLNSDQDRLMNLMLGLTGLESALNRGVLQVAPLPAGNYILMIDGQAIARHRQDAFERGDFDLCADPRFPWNIQAQGALLLTLWHNDLHFQRWRQVQVPAAKDGETVSEETKQRMDALDAQEADVVKQLRAAVQPKSHRIELIAITGH